jgi:uncharacterized protein (DUF2336 family)
MMLPAQATTVPSESSPPAARLRQEGPAYPSELFARLRETALSGRPALFQTALADALGLSFEAAAKLTAYPDLRLLAALRALDLNGEQAFLLISAMSPQAETDAEAIRLFLYRYGLIDPAEARARLGLSPSRHGDGAASNDAKAREAIRQAS